MYDVILSTGDSRACTFNLTSSTVVPASTTQLKAHCIFFVKALDILHAERIGHGYHVLEDNVLYKRIIDEGIHLEVSKIDQHK